MAKKEFGDGRVLLTGDDMIAAIEAMYNHRGAHSIECSFCQYEGNEEHCRGCTIADWETSCSCHINPPCGKCVGSKFEVSPYLINYTHHKQGRKNWECFKGDHDTFEKLSEIESIGLKLSAEMLTTGEIAMYIDDGVERDYEIEICAKADFKQVLCKMVNDFSIPIEEQ